MYNSLLLLLAIIPGILICVFLYFLDKYERESKTQLLICFLLGMAITFPALKIEAWIEYNNYSYTISVLRTLIFSFLGVALVEELLKLIVLIGYPFQRPFFNEPMDGIVYSMMIGMGFATLENVFYAFDFGWGTTILRAFTAVPAHAVFAVIMGYYVGLAKFHRPKRIQYILTGLGLAILVHGIYDFFILQEAYEWLMLFALVTLAVSIYYARKLVRLHQENSPFREEETEESIANNEA